MRWCIATLAMFAVALPPACAQFDARNAKEGAPMAKSAAEKRALETLDEVNRHHGYLSVPPEDGRLLRILAESIGARHIVELGTSTGYSGIWLALALRATGGKLTTYEIDPGRAAQAR